MSITIYRGSILDSTADVIVNPANSFLRHGGGLARIIANAAMDYRSVIPAKQPHGLHTDEEYDEIRYLAGEWQREQDEHPNIPTGGAGWTSAGAMNARYMGIIHAVGPIWGGGVYCEDTLLWLAHGSALNLAYKRGAKSIAFPAISCGIFGYPVEYAADTAADAVRSMAAIDVEFWLFEDAHVDAYEKAFDIEASTV